MKIHFKYNKKCPRNPNPVSTYDASIVTCKFCTRYIERNNVIPISELPKQLAIRAKRVVRSNQLSIKCPFCGDTHYHGYLPGDRVPHCHGELKLYWIIPDLPKDFCGFECSSCEFTDQNCPGKEYAMKPENKIHII